MVRTLIATLLFWVATTASAGWVGDWWGNVYNQRFQSEQYQQIQTEELTRCGYKLRWYRKKVEEHPTSEYYRYKLEDWTGRCGE